MVKNTLSQKTLKEYLSYDPDTGLFIWLKKRNSSAGKVKRGVLAGCKTTNGYQEIGLLGRRYTGHRLAFLYMLGAFPDEEVDHVNHNRLDNRWANLRSASRTQNGRNLSKKSNNMSGVTGVSWSKQRRKWCAAIMVNRKMIALGRRSNFDEAVALRRAAEVKYGFHKQHGK